MPALFYKLLTNKSPLEYFKRLLSQPLFHAQGRPTLVLGLFHDKISGALNWFIQPKLGGIGMFRLPFFVALLFSVLFFVACGPPTPPGSEFIGQWRTQKEYKFGPGDPAGYSILEITHNNDNQYFITFIERDPDVSELCKGDRAIAIYKDGMLEFNDGKGSFEPECRSPDGSKYWVPVSFSSMSKAIIDKKNGTLSLPGVKGRWNEMFGDDNVFFKVK